MKLICYQISSALPIIRPASANRNWMDATPERFANRCLPLSIANSYGWEILSPSSFSAVWDGGEGQESLNIVADVADEKTNKQLPVSHFGSGILTFHVSGLFQTSPGISLWVGGPSNCLKDGIQPLAGIVETDWLPFPFTMNWKFTRANHPVHFEKDEPFCFIYPLAIDTLENVEPEFRSLADNPELEENYRQWSQSRKSFLNELKQPGSASQQQKWQKNYHQGRRPDGSQTTNHRTKVKLHPFEDKTAESKSDN